jgi:hypothetical protein
MAISELYSWYDSNDFTICDGGTDNARAQKFTFSERADALNAFIAEQFAKEEEEDVDIEDLDSDESSEKEGSDDDLDLDDLKLD